MMTQESILATIHEQSIRFINLWFVDIAGSVKSIILPAHAAEAFLEHGTLFDGSAIEGFTRKAESDMVLVPDLDTFVVLPWDAAEERTARILCNVKTAQGEPFLGDPRNVLLRALKQAADMGFRYKTGIELEFFLFKGDSQGLFSSLTPHDEVSYFDLSTNFRQSIRRKMVASLESLGIGVDSAHHEIGSGQHEIDLTYDDAMRSADNVLTARIALKSIAQHNQMHCTFMPRPRADLPGSGMHTHQSLHSLETDENVFVDTENEYGLSETGMYFLAGQLHHARAICAVLAPLVNSYKRLGTSVEAPVYVTWAHINRGALIRVPSNPHGRETHTRLELRCPDPSSNPYLAAAVMLQAGLDGIRNKMPLPAPVEETLIGQDRLRLRGIPVLPTSLGEALDALSQDDVILSALGPHLSHSYIQAKRQEFDEYNRQVTPWEIEQYITRY
jgi:glutamine synthetase